MFFFRMMPKLTTSIHHNVLPNYLRTFIYRMNNSLLPLKSNYTVFGLDNDSRCEFCKLNFETNDHVFMNCKYVKAVWEIIETKTGLQLLNSNIIHFRHSNNSAYYNIIVYVTALVCHKIWKLRNEIRHGEVENFSSDFIVNSFIKSFYSRKLFEERRNLSIYQQEFSDILQRISR